MRGKVLAVVFIVAAILILIGVVTLSIIPKVINDKIIKEVFLGFDANGTYNELTKNWIKPKYHMEVQFNVFSIKNRQEILKGSDPEFEVKGPYIFTEHQWKSKVNFIDENRRVIYRNRRIYIYNQAASCTNCTLNDSVVIPNLMFQKLVDFANSSLILKALIDFALRMYVGETPFTKTTVGELLFGGIRDPLLQDLCNLSPLLEVICTNEIKIRFMKNDTDDGEFVIGTGLNGTGDIGKVYEWNGRNSTPLTYWSSPEARMLNGTDCEIFPPGLHLNRDLYIFLEQLGRSLYLRNSGVNIEDDVPVYRYRFPEELFDWNLPENRGFCRVNTPRYFNESVQPAGCLPPGLLDISSFQSGNARIYISGSHFYRSSPELYSNFKGFGSPNSVDDDTFIDIEPLTGTIAHARQTSQINIGMLSGGLSMTSSMRNTIMPILYMNETIHFDEETRNLLKSGPLTAYYVMQILAIISLSIGALCLIFLVVYPVCLCCRCCKRSNDEERLVTADSSHSIDNFVE